MPPFTADTALAAGVLGGRPKGVRTGEGKQALAKRGKAALRRRLMRCATLSAEHTLELIRRGGYYDPRELFDSSGNLRPIAEWSEAQAAMVAQIDVVQGNLDKGDGQSDRIVRVRLVDRAKYLEMAAKHHGLLVDRVDHSGAVTFRHELEAEPASFGPVIDVLPDAPVATTLPEREPERYP